jgi:hypothetical protein
MLFGDIRGNDPGAGFEPAWIVAGLFLALAAAYGGLWLRKRFLRASK